MKRLLIVVLLGSFLSNAHAQEVPKTISYMGYLTDAAGDVVADGDHEITFRLYEQAAGGTGVWEATRTVTTSKGLFSVVLGETESLDGVPFDRAYYLGISIGAGDELAPRIALVAAPYSLYAKTVEDGAVTTAKIASNAVGTEQIADGSLLAEDVAEGAVVKSLNELTDAVTLEGGANITISSGDDNVLTIAADGLADGAVTSAKISDGSISSADIAAGEVVTSVNSVTDGVTIAGSGTVTVATTGNTVTITAAASELVDGTVTSAKITDGAIATADLADGAVSSAKLADGTIATVDLAANAVTATQIAADAVTTAKIQDAAVTAAKLADATAVLSLNNATDDVTLQPGANINIERVGQNITISTTGGNEIGTGDIADNSITSAKIIDSAVTEADLGADAVTSAKIADATIVSADIAGGVVVSSVNALTGAVTLAAGTNIAITPVGNTLTIDATAGGDITGVTAGTGLTGGGTTGDVTVDIDAGGVGTAELAADAVTSAKIIDGTIVAADIGVGEVGTAELAADAVTSGKIADATIVAADIATGAVATDEILDATIATTDLAPDAVTSAKIADGTITAADVAAGQVVTSVNSIEDAVTLAAGANITVSEAGQTITIAATAGGDITGVTAGTGLANGGTTGDVTLDIAAGGVGTTELAAAAVTTAKIGTGAVTSAEIANATIVAGDVAPGAVVLSVNGLTDAVILNAGTNMAIGAAGNTLTFNATDTNTDTDTQNTLDGAYDEGGVGAGRTITADNGAVDIAGAGGLTVNGNVGIGTTTPGDKFHVLDASGTIAKFEGSGGTGPVSINDGAYSGIGTVGAVDFNLFTGGIQRLTVDSSGNVGLGTSTPAVPLSIRRASGTNALYISNDGAAAGDHNHLWFISDRDGTSDWAGVGIHNGDGELRLTGSNSLNIPGMTLDDGNNVGIGTTTPATNLPAAFDDDSGNAKILDIRSAVAGDVGLFLGRADGSTTGMQMWTDYSAGHTYFDNLYDNADGDIRFRTRTAGTAVDAVHIQGDGNVGIGTTSPNYTMQLHEPSAAQNYLQFTNTNTGTTATDGFELGIDAIGNARVQNAEATNLDFWTSNVQRMTIAANGNVGIGETTPLHPLSFEAVTGTKINLYDDEATPAKWGIGVEVSELRMASNGFTSFYTGGYTGTEVMRVGSGNVTIGTTTAYGSEYLTVARSAAEVVAFNRTANDGTIVSLRQDNTEEGTISISGTTISYNAFTGSHYGWTERTIDHGTLVTLTGDNRRYHDNAESEIIYGVIPSSVPNDPKILGAYLALQESQDPAGPDNPHLVMAVGNGVMWVVDDGQDVEIGDHLISSAVAGHAMRDSGEFPVSHIVAIAVEPVYWDEVEESVDGRKHRRISVLFERFALNNAVQSAADPAELTQVKAELSELRSEKETLARSNDELRMQLDALTAAVRRLEAMAAVETEVELAAR